MTEISELAGRPVIIGGGAAGLATALALAPEPVVLLSKAPLGEATSSGWAQGGMAATLGQDDEPQLHFEDTIAAGDGLCQPQSCGQSSKRRLQLLTRLPVLASPSTGIVTESFVSASKLLTNARVSYTQTAMARAAN